MVGTIVDSAFPSVVRTERGLTVGGRRLTLYFLEDHFKAGWSNELIRQRFSLSEQEIADVVGYMAAHRSEFDLEYQQVLKDSEENRKYWEERNRDRMERIASTPPTPEVAAKRATLEEIRRRRRS
jgi:hypothetical protein